MMRMLMFQGGRDLINDTNDMNDNSDMNDRHVRKSIYTPYKYQASLFFLLSDGLSHPPTQTGLRRIFRKEAESGRLSLSGARVAHGVELVVEE